MATGTQQAQNIREAGIKGMAEIAQPSPQIDYDAFFVKEDVVDVFDLSAGGKVDTLKMYNLDLNMHYVSWVTDPKYAHERGLGDPISAVTSRIPNSEVIRHLTGPNKGQPVTQLDVVAVKIPIGLKEAYERFSEKEVQKWEGQVQDQKNFKFNDFADRSRADWHEQNQLKVAQATGDTSATRGLDYERAVEVMGEKNVLAEEYRFRKHGSAISQEKVDQEVEKIMAERSSRKNAKAPARGFGGGR